MKGSPLILAHIHLPPSKSAHNIDFCENPSKALPSATKSSSSFMCNKTAFSVACITTRPSSFPFNLIWWSPFPFTIAYLSVSKHLFNWHEKQHCYWKMLGFWPISGQIRQKKNNIIYSRQVQHILVYFYCNWSKSNIIQSIAHESKDVIEKIKYIKLDWPSWWSAIVLGSLIDQNLHFYCSPATKGSWQKKSKISALKLKHKLNGERISIDWLHLKPLT